MAGATGSVVEAFNDVLGILGCCGGESLFAVAAGAETATVHVVDIGYDSVVEIPDRTDIQPAR